MSCTANDSKRKETFPEAADREASHETQALLISLKKLAPHKIIFGQQNATAFGVDWRNEDLRSDINDVCGRFPAMYSWNLGYMDASENLDSVKYDRMKFWIKSAFERGGINTITLYLKNPVTNGLANDTTLAVNHIFQKSIYIDGLKKQLIAVATFLNDLKTKKGTHVPIILSLYHNNNTNEFWWGNGSCSPDDFKKLFRFTVTYLRDTCQVHNILYGYSTDIFKDIKEYSERYPGNEFVDIVGFQNFLHYKPPYNEARSVELVRSLVLFAEKNNKIPAICATGLQTLNDEFWFTKRLLNPIKNDSIAKRVSYIIIGPNMKKNLYFAPYNGHLTVKDFIQFENDPVTVFEEDLPDMYHNY